MRDLRARGFTLIEVMILIVIGIILAGVALPGAHTLDDRRVAAAARILEADLQFAQARAIATGQNHRVLFVIEPLSTSYQVESPPGVVLQEPLSRKPWVRVLEDGTEIQSANFNGGRAVIFNGAGEPSSGGTVLLRLAPFDAAIGVSAVTGEVTLTLP